MCFHPHTLKTRVSYCIPTTYNWSAVGNVAAQRRKQHAVTVGKERREALVRTKRLCRVGVSGDIDDPVESDMIIDEEQSILEAQTTAAVEELKLALAYQYVAYVLI